jgi:hypothetical protein
MNIRTTRSTGGQPNVSASWTLHHT